MTSPSLDREFLASSALKLVIVSQFVENLMVSAMNVVPPRI